MSRTNAAGLARGRPRSPFCELTPVDGIAIYMASLAGSFLALSERVDLPRVWGTKARGFFIWSNS